MEVKFCPKCEKPVQSASLSTRRQACASCGWTGNIVERPVSKKKELVTVAHKKRICSTNQDIFIGLFGMPLLGIITGSLLMLIPIIGWIAGIGMIIRGFSEIFVALRALGIKLGWIKPKEIDFKLEGRCPYCHTDLSVNLPSKKTTCKFCRKKVLIQQDRFCTII